MGDEVTAVLWASDCMRVVRIHGDLGISVERQILADGEWRRPTVDEDECLALSGAYLCALLDAAEELHAWRMRAGG